MDEISYTKALVEQLKPSFPNYEVEPGISIFYSLIVDEDGNIPMNQNQRSEPKRGGGTAFEQDVLVFERVAGQTGIVPRIAIEVKLDGVTTHDAIVYSEKARLLRNVYPYLKYGFLVGNIKSLPPRLLRTGTEFDFILRVSNPPIDSEVDALIILLGEEIETSHKLGKIFSNKATINLIHRRIVIDPDIKPTRRLNPMVNMTIKSSGNNPVGVSVDTTYYVYENWTAENKAVIHFGKCSSCNYGKGIHPEKSTRNGQWHGPFLTYSNTEKTAKDTGRPVRLCKKCAPS